MKNPLTIMWARKLLKGSHMGFGRKSKAVKMLRRKGQAKKKAKIKQKISAGKLTKKR
jgi:hypothetical protein